MPSKIKRETFKLGETVSWLSQAGGFDARKTGEIVAVMPPKCHDIPGLMRQLGEKYNCVKQSGWGYCRDHESYVILVRPMGKARPRLYWPVVSLLHRVEPADA
jgi:hypothetical protein